MTLKSQSGQVDRNILFTSVVSSALEYYKSFVTVATTFLIGSLYLLREGFVPSGKSFWFLVGGALLLVVAIGLILETQRQNITSGNMAVRGDFDGATKIDCKKKWLGRIAIWTCVSGMVLVVVSGVLGFQGGKMAKEDERQDKKAEIERRNSIDFGSTGPVSKPAENKPSDTAKPPPTNKPETPKDKE